MTEICVRYAEKIGRWWYDTDDDDASCLRLSLADEWS